MAFHRASWDQSVVERAVLDANPDYRMHCLSVIDCRDLHDPSGQHLRSHCGVHTENLGPIVGHAKFPHVMRCVATECAKALRQKPPVPWTVVAVCKSGRHRSQAVGRVMAEVGLTDKRFKLGRIIDLTDGRWSGGCGGCSSCKWFGEDSRRDKLLAQALCHWNRQLDQVLQTQGL
jgi:hypothetical protein